MSKQSSPQFSLPLLLERVPGRVYLLVSVVIFATANAVTRRLTELGAQFPIDGRNPISFCNVLFVGNLYALATLLVIHHRQLNWPEFRHLSGKNWLSLVGIAVLAGALAPAWFFLALDLTSANNVLLLGRIEPPLVLALSVLLLRERVNRWVVAGAVFSFIGVVLTIVLQPPKTGMVQMSGIHLGKGELLALGAAIAVSIATIISKLSLQHIPFGIFNVVRTVIATVVFFAVATALFGLQHFADTFSPFVWQWMLIYGVVIVVGGQLTRLQGLKRTNAAEVALASSFGPIAGVLAAYLILGEAPTQAQYIGGAVIMVGIGLNQIGVWRQAREIVPPLPMAVADRMERDEGLGFKGV